MYRFALRPAWLLSHVLVLALFVALVNLGLWQLRRLDERRDRNDAVAAQAAQGPVPVGTVLPSRGVTAAEAADLQYRPVTAVGTYASASLLVDNRSLDGRPGAWVVTPLVMADGTSIAVNRGFVGVGGDGRAALPPLPQDEVTLVGRLEPFADRTCATRTDGGGDVVGAACLSLDAVESATGAEVAGMALHAVESTPADDAALSAVPLPEPGDGPHLSYAVQWFIFATIALVGYPLILRKNARERAGRDDDDLDGELRDLLASEGHGP